MDVSAYDEEQTASIQLQKQTHRTGGAFGTPCLTYTGLKTAKTSSCSLDSRTNAAGEIVVESLKFGTYFFLETKMPVATRCRMRRASDGTGHPGRSDSRDYPDRDDEQ